MKVFTRYSRINLLATVFIFLLAILAFYFFLRYVLIRQVDEDLQIEQEEIKQYTDRYQKLPEIVKVTDQDIHYTTTTEPVIKNVYKTIPKKSGREDARQLVYSLYIQGNWYNITITKSLEGTDHLSRSVATMALLTILLILAASFIVNRVVLRRLWRPFYGTLEAMQEFRLGSDQQLQLPESNIDEFIFMNSTLQQATQKANQDYILLKEFTENASHELQTPLAIIQNKLELVMQDNLTEAQSIALQGANEAIQKLSRFNKSLLLLAKIQNNQFADKASVNLKAIIENKINAFKEIWEEKRIILHVSLQEKWVLMNMDLAGMLINNLFSNAIKHNISGGEIYLSLADTSFIISNTGDGLVIDESRLFTRFYNPANSKSNTGLGLSIVKQICDASDFDIRYRFIQNQHTFSIIF